VHACHDFPSSEGLLNRRSSDQKQQLKTVGSSLEHNRK